MTQEFGPPIEEQAPGTKGWKRFEGTALPLPEPWSQQSERYTAPAAGGHTKKAVRHAEGYTEFVVFSAELGANLNDETWDTTKTAAFIAQHGAELGLKESLLRSAAIYLGNTLTEALQEAHWEVLDQERPEVWANGRGLDVIHVVRELVRGNDAVMQGVRTLLAAC